MQTPLSLLNTDFGSLARLPVRDQISDRLADLMYVADEILTTVDFNSTATEAVKWVEPELKEVYELINAMMKRLGN